jgi:hypothetical protein
MPCTPFRIETPTGPIVGIMCSRGQHPRAKCSVCGKPSTLLCDFKLDIGKTCDKPLCRKCAVHPVAYEDIDYCPTHRAAMEAK